MGVAESRAGVGRYPGTTSLSLGLLCRSPGGGRGFWRAFHQALQLVLPTSRNQPGQFLNHEMLPK